MGVYSYGLEHIVERWAYVVMAQSISSSDAEWRQGGTGSADGPDRRAESLLADAFGYGEVAAMTTWAIPIQAYSGHNYIGHNYIGHNFTWRRFWLRRGRSQLASIAVTPGSAPNIESWGWAKLTIGMACVVMAYTDTRDEYVYWRGTSSMAHNYKGHNYIGHNYIGNDYAGHGYIGHDYTCCLWDLCRWRTTV